MMCPTPILIKNKYGYIREVPCGQCKACRLNKCRDWSNRIVDETKFYKDNTFLTLTYDDEHLPERGTLVKRHLQLFQKRLRKCLEPLKIRFFSVGEYGELSNRCHYHLIVFGLSPTDKIFKNKRYDKKHDGWKSTMDIWEYGFVFSAPVTYDDAQYVAGYCMKKLTGKKSHYYEDRGLLPPFVICSNRPGIGYRWIMQNGERIARHGYVIGKNGKKCPIPRYYQEKIFSEFGRFCRSHEAFMDKIKNVAEEAEKQGKEYWRYKEEMLQSAKDRVDAFIKMKGKCRDVEN